MMTSLSLWIIFEMNRYLTCLEVWLLVFIVWLFGKVILEGVSSRQTFPQLLNSRWVESAWTYIPALMLLGFIVPMIGCLYSLDGAGVYSDVLHVSGNQWYWTVQSAGESETIGFRPDSTLESGDLRVVSPTATIEMATGESVRVLLGSNDVIHSFAVPSLGVKLDCIPGRLNGTSMTTVLPGLYYGQCSELCGAAHGFMPLCVRVS